jgi:ABC-type Fe3+ transport system permease subunit
MIVSVIFEAWSIYRKNFLLIASLVLLVWIPLDLISSYFDAFVFEEDDYGKSFRLSQALDSVFGIITTAAVTFATFGALSGNTPGFGASLAKGFRCWGRMFWARFLSGLMIVVGLILLIIPGIYLAVRLMLIEAIVVAEGVTGNVAIQRAMRLSEGRFWRIAGLSLTVGFFVTLPCLLVVLPVYFFVDAENWLIDAAVSIVCEVILAFPAICFACTYRLLIAESPDLTLQSRDLIKGPTDAVF